jgi:signal transduction histidine kinase
MPHHQAADRYAPPTPSSLPPTPAVADEPVVDEPQHDLIRRLLAEPRSLAALLELIPIATWVYGADGRPVTMNSHAVRVIGGSVDDAHAVVIRDDPGPDVDLFHPDGAAYAFAEYPVVRALRGETVRDEEIIIVTSWRAGIYLVNTAPLLGEDGHVVGSVSTAQDIGVQKRLEAELERGRRAALESSRAKSRMLRALSHDVRMPLNAVALSSEILLAHVRDPDASDVVEAAHRIRKAIENVTDLLNDALGLSRIEAGAEPLHPTRFALDEALAECLASVEPAAREKGLACRFIPGPAAGLAVTTDRVKLKQVVANLLANAVRYTPRGSVTLRVETAPGAIRVAVADTGVGIAAEDRERIFLEYTRLPSARQAAEEGSGLGLAIARGLATLLDGRIELESAPGRGSTFTLVLPDSIAESPTPPDDQGHPNHHGRHGPDQHRQPNRP